MEQALQSALCLGVSSDPVSSFSRTCLSPHRSKVAVLGSRCPQGRAPRASSRMTLDTCGQCLVEPVPKQLCKKTEPGPGAKPGRPVQLVRLDEDGGLILDEGALSRCLEQGGVGGAPVCLVSIIGEQRRGKSFLLNYLLRRLRSPDASDGSWMGQEEEPLEGFEWHVGTQNVTKGVWAWSQPFWVPTEGGQVAVLLVDTEGSMDVASNKETSNKLSALSMLLSSYQILNIGCQVNEPDLEYLEMFLHVAEVVGEEYGLEPVQHLDLLVRDWSSSLALGAEGGEQHLGDVRERLAATSPCKHPKALAVLGRSSSSCYLMPYPGKRIATGSVGALRDMDEDFQESLRDYVTALVGSAGRHVRRDRQGEPLTGAQLAARIKNLWEVMKTHRFGFSSPCQMAIAFRNQRAMDSARQQHAALLREKDALSRRMADCLQVDPGTMAQQLGEQRRAVLGRCRGEMQEPEEALLTALEQELTQEAETFLPTYSQRHQRHTRNQGALDRARAAHTEFLREKDTFFRRMWVDPDVIAQQLKEQLKKQMKELEKLEKLEKDLLVKLELKLTQEAEDFLMIYRDRYLGRFVKCGVAVLCGMGIVMLSPVFVAAVKGSATAGAAVGGSAMAGAAVGGSAMAGVAVGGSALAALLALQVTKNQHSKQA